MIIFGDENKIKRELGADNGNLLHTGNWQLLGTQKQKYCNN